MANGRKEKSPLAALRSLDYTVIFCRDLSAMVAFYRDVLECELDRALSDGWFEFRIGQSVLALSRPGGRFPAPAVAEGTPALQLAFRVPVPAVDACAQALAAKGVVLLDGPTDQPFGHRTLFFRDPDGNLLEIYAEI